MHQVKCVKNNIAQSVAFRSCLYYGLKMFPHTPDKTKLPGHHPKSHLKIKTKQTIQICNRPPTQLPPSPAQDPRVQVIHTPPHSAPRVDIIPPPDITDINTDKPIAHHTQASCTTPAAPIQQTHNPFARRTRSQINPKGIAQQVDISPRQASQQKFPRSFIHNWSMPVMDTVTGETLENLQLRRHPKYKKTWNQSYSNELGRL